jgi:hypothetical protein
MIGGKPAARMGDQCAHGGAIASGCVTVLIGEVMGGGGGGMAAMPVPALEAVMKSVTGPIQNKVAQVVALKKAAVQGVPFCEECAKAKASK